jgi:hypothetical protein
MKTLKEKIEVMQAALAGAEIQYKDRCEWYTATSPWWDWENTDYRIKPENKQVPYDFSDAESLIGKKVKRLTRGQAIGIITSIYETVFSRDAHVIVFEERISFKELSEEYEIWNNTLNRWEPCTKTVKE